MGPQIQWFEGGTRLLYCISQRCCLSFELPALWFPPWGRRGFKPRIRPPYPERVVKRD